MARGQVLVVIDPAPVKEIVIFDVAGYRFASVKRTHDSGGFMFSQDGESSCAHLTPELLIELGEALIRMAND